VLSQCIMMAAQRALPSGCIAQRQQGTLLSSHRLHVLQQTTQQQIGRRYTCAWAKMEDSMLLSSGVSMNCFTRATAKASSLGL
jgi:hypothetical protein